MVAFFVAAEDQLSSILVPGEDWQVVADNLNFCDGLSCDAAGNVYFCELKAKPAVIYRIAPDNSRTKVAETARSGTKVGPDGKLYCCGNKAITCVDMGTGKETVLTDKDVVPNDMVITKSGLIFITETASKRLTCFNTKTKEQKVADEGTVNKPNGIGLSPDQSTLIVSEIGGTKVWTFKIEADGSLTDKKPLMTMKAPESKPTVASGDGMTVDTAGRAYVTTALGVQIFAPTGELLGVLPKINEKSALVSAGFGGPGLAYLYIAHGDKIYRRKLNARGTGSFPQ
jgi:enterochelin esterase family protein